MKSIYFTIDHDFVFEGFVQPNNTWNGWLQPFVERDTYVTIFETLIAPNMHDPEFMEYFGDDAPSLDDKPNSDGYYYLNWGWCWEEALPQDDATDFMNWLEVHQYRAIHTGGGCSAWVKDYGVHKIYITQDSSHNIELKHMEDIGVYVGVHSENLEGNHLFFVVSETKNFDDIKSIVMQVEKTAHAMECLNSMEKVDY